MPLFLSIETSDENLYCSTLVALQDRIRELLGEFVYWHPIDGCKRGEVVASIHDRHEECIHSGQWRSDMLAPLVTLRGVVHIHKVGLLRCKEVGCDNVMRHEVDVERGRCDRHLSWSAWLVSSIRGW